MGAETEQREPGAIETHILYIRESIDEIKEKQSIQDEIIQALNNNCNREERWDMIRADIKELKLDIRGIKKRLDELESANSQETGAKQANVSIRELVSWGITVILFLLVLWDRIGGSS